MDSKELLTECKQADAGVILLFRQKGGDYEPLAEPLTVNAGDNVRIYRGDDGKLHGEIVPPPPKEPRYRRKPLEWVDDDAKSHRTNTPIGHFFVDYVCQRWVITWSSGMTLDTAPTLEEAKARVEAEITRRLESVLEVCE